MGSLITIHSRGSVDPDRLIERVRRLGVAGRLPVSMLTIDEFGLTDPDGVETRIVCFSFDVGAAAPLTLHIDRASGRIAAPCEADKDGEFVVLADHERFVIRDAADGSYREHLRALAVLEALGESISLTVTDSTGFAEHRDETRLVAEMALSLCRARAASTPIATGASEWI